MSSITRLTYGDNAPEPGKRRFRGHTAGGRADRATVDRQARLTLVAFNAHDEREDALRFLNGHSDALGGRPLDVAGQTDAGLAAAIALLDGGEQTSR